MERDNFVFFTSWLKGIEGLPLEEQMEIVFAIVKYCSSGKLPDLKKPYVRLAFNYARPTMDKGIQMYLNGKQPKRKQMESKREANGEQNESKSEAKEKQNESKNEANVEQIGSRMEAYIGIGKGKGIGKGNEKEVSIVRDTHNALSNTQVSDAAFEADSEEVRRKLAETKRAKDIAEYYNATVKKASAKLRACLHVNDFRRGLILARIAEYGEETLRQVIDKAVVSNFLNYEATNAPVDLEWLMRPKNFPKVLEGKYDNRTAENGKPSNIHFAGENDRSVYDHEEENWL